MFGQYSKSLKVGLTTALVISACVVDSVTIAYDGSVMGSINIMPSYNKYFDITTTLKAVNSTATHLGAILMALFAGFIVDSRGRVPSLMYSALFNVLGAVISAAAQNLAMFIAGRMIVGLGMGLAQAAAGSYVSETTAPRVRAFALGLYYTCWALGSILATGVSFACTSLEPSTWAWRVPCLFQGFAPILILVLIPFLPESPRWLLSKDRLDEGLKVIALINGSSIDAPAVQLQYKEIVDTLNYEKGEGKSIPLINIMRSPTNRRRLVLALSVAPLTMLTGSNVITYYYGDMLSQAGISSPRTQMAISLSLSAWQFFVALAGCFLADKLGRRILCMTSLGACTIMFYTVGALTYAYGGSSYTPGIAGTVTAIFLYLAAYSFGLTPLTQMYAPEVLSFNIRATGLGFLTIANKACGIFVTMVFPYLFDSIQWKTYMVNASWNCLFVIFVYFFWVETKGRTLEEIDELFDGVKHSDVPDLATIEDGKKSMETRVEKV